MAELRRRSRHPLPTPREIDGRRPERILAAGDRAEVHLYRDAAGRDPIAVKVFRDVLDHGEREVFAAAAARLVALSTHPSVTTVHSAGTTDEGRPYLVMEYCSRADLAETASRSPMSVPEALRLLVRLCGAVETAHRSGIAHGRVGIENVLTTDYGWPAMIGFDTDALLRRDVSGATTAARAADVHGLAVAATELLTGRPIAETTSALAGADAVPAELETLVLATLEATAAGDGPSAAEFGLALQRIEADRHLPITHLDVREPDAAATAEVPAPDEDERTVLSTRHSAPDDDHTVLSTRHTAPDDDHTRLAARSLPVADGAPTPSERPAIEPDVEPTAFVRRQRRDDLVRGRVDTARQATGPDDGGERYRVRTAPALAEVSRVHVEAPVRQSTTTPVPRRRGRGTVIAVIGVGAIVLGAAATAIVMIIGGGA